MWGEAQFSVIRALSQNEIMRAQTICGTVDDAVIEQKTWLLVRPVPTDKSNKKKRSIVTPNGHFFLCCTPTKLGVSFVRVTFYCLDNEGGRGTDIATKRGATLAWIKKLWEHLKLLWNRSINTMPVYGSTQNSARVNTSIRLTASNQWKQCCACLNFPFPVFVPAVL